MDSAQCQRKDKFRLEIEKDVFILQAFNTEKHELELPDHLKLKNISRSGLCLISDIELKQGTVIEAEIMLEDVQDSVTAYCQAVWNKKNGKNRQFETGMKFLGIKDEDSENLGVFLEKNLLSY
jgi:hypothetical protein